MKTVLTLNDKMIEKLHQYYKAYEVLPNTNHIQYLFKTDYFTITVYHSKKVMFQGEDAVAEYNQWAELIGLDTYEEDSKAISSTYMNEYYHLSIIGSDEVGTGDFFGPVVVTAAMVSPSMYGLLDQFNIKDSKKITDDYIRLIAPQLIKEIPHHTLILDNLKYNDLINQGYNMNKIKAYLHNHAIKKLIHTNIKYDQIMIDQFCSESLYYSYLKDQTIVKNVILKEKAESVHQSVAVAAIIARYQFLKAFDELSQKINITLPKGAGPQVDAIGKLIHLKLGDDVFQTIAKIHFKNMIKIRDSI